VTTLYYDTESYCETPIAAGVHRYAEDPFAEIMLESWAIDDGPVAVNDLTAGEQSVWTIFDPEDFDEIVIHNSMFDRTMVRTVGGIDIPVRLIHDTMVQARAHGLPGGLDKLCSIFRVPEELSKHSVGKKLIQLFCKPRPKSFKLRRATRLTHPKEWEEFKAYAGGDIEAIRYLKPRLPRWNYPDREHALWEIDQRINDRGFFVDQELAHAAIATIADVKAEVNAETFDQTDGRLHSTTQRDKLLEELLLEHGVRLPDMQQGTLERRLEDPDLPMAAKALIEQRLLVSGTSTAKYQKALDAVCEDGRLRGSLQFCGAARTKRWSGQIFQPQNLPRPDMPVEEVLDGIELMKSGMAWTMHDEPGRLAWNALRGLVIASPGRKIVQADFSQIEARVLPWLAGAQWKLDAFRAFDEGRGPDTYVVGAARILGISIEEVTKALRQMYGKVPELACGYGGASGAFASMVEVLRMEPMSPDVVATIVREWREANPEIANWTDGLWVRLEEGAREAIQSPGRTVEVGYVVFEKWRNWLKMRLPSGGWLSYADPHFYDHPHGGPNSLCFWGVNSYTKRWERLYTYGGKLSADATQATARELLAYNFEHIEEQGFPIVLQVHDEVITEPVDDPNYSVNNLVAALTRRPPWIDDKLPISADGFEAYRYRKED